MFTKARQMWSWQGAVSRRTFVIAGAVLFALKYLVDSGIAAVFRESWSPLMYLSPRVSPLLHPERAPQVGLTLLGAALPVRVAGVALCARRSRDMGVHPFWAGLFFLPFFHFVFFSCSLSPHRTRRAHPPSTVARIASPNTWSPSRRVSCFVRFRRALSRRFYTASIALQLKSCRNRRPCGGPSMGCPG